VSEVAKSGAISRGSLRAGPANVSVINQGVIQADAAGGTIILAGQPFTNQGLVRSRAGSTILLRGAWSNQGIVELDNGALNLAGKDRKSVVWGQSVDIGAR